MFYDFLRDCRCVLSEEAADFHDLLAHVQHLPVSVGFMPAIWDDLYPVYALACTSAKKIVSPNVYIIPIAAHGDFARGRFEQMVSDFYSDDTFRDQYEIELEEMLLLSPPALPCSFSFRLEDTEYNVILLRITMPDDSEKILIITPLTPHAAWKDIMEAYRIPCDIVIDSGKGMGDWFEEIPLFPAMMETRARDLLPRYYFRGKHISHDAPDGFRLVYTISEPMEGVGDWEKEIYATDWSSAHAAKN